MAAHTVDIDVIDKSALPEDHSNIPVINQPNPCYGYSATAKEVNYLMHFAQYCIYESGTNNIINGNTYLNYFPEEGGGGGGGGGITPEEVQNMINSSMRTLAPVASSGDYDDLIDKPVIDSATSTESTNAIQNKGITNFVNSSIETATATFRGTYTTIETLNAASGDKNDYAFYNHTDAAGNTVFDRYKFVPTEQADLPEGYTQLEYIESSGTQYIDTGVLPTSKTRAYIKIDPLIYRYATCFFGTSGYSNRGYHDPYYLNSDNESGKFLVDGISAVVSLDFPGVNEFEYNYPYITLNGDSVNIGDPGEWYYGAGNAIYLFASNSNGQVSSFATMRLYGFKLYDTDGVTLIRDFVPCKNASNIAGLYDLINATFYPNKGTGSFIAGPQANGYWEYEFSIPGNLFSSTQFAALNSGINNTKVEQIESNKNNISLLETKVNTNTGVLSQTYNSADCNMSIYLCQDKGAINDSTYYMTDQSKMHFEIHYFRRLLRYWKDGVDYQKYRWTSVGVIATNNSAKKDMLTLDIPGVTNETYVKIYYFTDDDGEDPDRGYSWQKTSVNVGDVWYIRPHIEYTDLETGMKYTMYGAVYKVTVGTPCTIECDTLSCTELTAREQANENNISLLQEQVGYAISELEGVL